jgi:hypothetical protein
MPTKQINVFVQLPIHVHIHKIYLQISLPLQS